MKKTNESSRAKGRWKLLQHALLSNCNGEDYTEYSIHRFPGFQMLLAPIVAGDEGMTVSRQFLKDNLGRIAIEPIPWYGSFKSSHQDWPLLNKLSEDLVCSVKALEALDSTALKTFELVFTLAIDDGKSFYFDLQEFLISQTSEALGDGYTVTNIPAASATENENCLRVLVTLPSQNSANNYCVKFYTVFAGAGDVPLKTVVTRERRTTMQRRSLHELVSHQRHDAVDNTGNICVWDCERTLCWVLQQQEQQKQERLFHTILELGAGMAGLAALSMAASAFDDATRTDCSVPRSKIYITDGHADSVLNNKINVCLMRAAGLLSEYVAVECRRLKWTIDTTKQSSLQADLTIVSDCAHFQEYHAELFWTLVTHTVVGGQILMCQPLRGCSWERFFALVVAVNNNNTQPLLTTQERTYSELEEKHEHFSKTDPNYNPSIHQPRIFVLEKIREAVEADRRAVLQHIHDRSQNH